MNPKCLGRGIPDTSNARSAHLTGLKMIRITAPFHSITSSARAGSVGPFHSITGLDRLWSWLVSLLDLKMRDIVKGTAYEKCLQHSAFLGIDLLRSIEAILTSQCFHRRRGREHPIGLTRCLEARGDVDGIAPDDISELAGANDHCHHRTEMQAHPDRK